ncbi:MAG: hypothetical protein OHK0045_08850 [Raineya sp.]
MNSWKVFLLLITTCILSASSCKKLRRNKQPISIENPIKVEERQISEVKLPKAPAKLAFKYLSSDTKIEFTDGTNDGKFKVAMRIRKDSLIWLSMRANVGVEGLRMLISKDSIQIIDYQEKTYRNLSFKDLSQEYGFELNYNLVQAILIGEMPIEQFDTKSVFQDSTHFIIRQKESFLSLDNFLNKENLQLEKLYVNDNQRGSQMELIYSNFIKIGEGLFPENNKVKLNYYNNQGNFKISLDIDHKKTKITDTALEFPFRIPARYKKM